MSLVIRLFFSYLICLSISYHCQLSAAIKEIYFEQLSLQQCLLPNDHPLQEPLKHLFYYDYMFESPEHFKSMGFKVNERVHRGLMVASHATCKNYLFKKFDNTVSQKEQLKNYLRRINGARALRQFIDLNHLKHIVVPQKWLYPLPASLSDRKTGAQSYILIVEEMDICSGGKDPHGEVARKYYDIDKEVLREICMVLYYFRGLDSVLHNLPFTHQNKIAFIDTDKWEEKREKFLPRIKPFLSKSNQKYVKEVYHELQSSHSR